MTTTRYRNRNKAAAATGALAGVAALSAGGAAQAAGKDGFVDLASVGGVADVKLLSDGSVEVVFTDGRIARFAPENIKLDGDKVLVSEAALADQGFGVDGDGGSFLADNALLIAGGVVLAGVGGAAAAGAFDGGDDDNDGNAATAGDDVLVGTAGADVLNGLEGNDNIDGLAGDDQLSGGAGNDVIIGGAGADALGGDAGDDRIVADLADIALDGGADANGDAPAIETGDTLDLSGATEGVFVDLDSQFGGAPNPGLSQTGFVRNVASGTGGEITFEIGADEFENIIGTQFDDRLFGNGEANVIQGGAGNDAIHAFGGSDVYDGGEGTDTALFNQAGAGVNADLAAGTAGSNTLISIENFNGGVFDDTIAGDDGANVLFGNGGADIIDGRGGDDVIIADTDDISLDGGDDNNADAPTTDNGDTLDLSGATEGVFVDLDANFGGAPNPGLSQEGFVRNVASGTGGAVTFDIVANDFENIIGTQFDDRLFGNGEANVIQGGAGDDAIHAFGGSDVYDGGEGTDTALFNQAGAGVNADLAAGTAGSNTLISIENFNGGIFDDTIAGDDVANALNGNSGADIIDGRGGDDVISGDGGSDTLTGGEGADVFAYAGDPFDGADVSAAGRQIIGDEDFIQDFDFANDVYRLNATDFGVEGDVSFVALDANAADAAIPAGSNVIVLLNADNDGDAATPFLAGTAAGQIADLVDADGAGFFVYFNTNLGVNRLVYSTNLNDADADLKIVSRQTDLTGDDAIAALASFSADNFEFDGVVATDDTIAVAAIADGEVIAAGAETVADAFSADDIATGDTLDLSGLTEGASADLDANNQGLLAPNAPSQEGFLTVGGATATLVDIENLIGTEFNDTLFGNQENNVILGGAGDDNIHPFGGRRLRRRRRRRGHVLNLSGATGGLTIDLASGVGGAEHLREL